MHREEVRPRWPEVRTSVASHRVLPRIWGECTLGSTSASREHLFSWWKWQRIPRNCAHMSSSEGVAIGRTVPAPQGAMCAANAAMYKPTPMKSTPKIATLKEFIRRVAGSDSHGFRTHQGPRAIWQPNPAYRRTPYGSGV